MSDDLRTLAAAVQGLSGIVVRDGQLASLRRALARVDPHLTPADLLCDPDPARLERVVEEVAIKETFFLRHLDELRDIDWPGQAVRAAAAGRRLRVWSAGCSTGEEAYSLALLAAEDLGGDRPPIDVLGTDLSASALALAERGRYGARSVRLVDRERRARWFAADGGRLRVGEELRGVVRFARHNLVHDPFPPDGEAPLDLVVCRNVLIYFDAPTAARVAAGLRGALAPGARLLLGTVDRLASAPPAAVGRAAAAPGRAERASPGPTVPGPAVTPPGGYLEPAARGSSAGAAHAAFEAGSRALSAGDAAAAVTALRRALYLDPRSAVVALQLARAHEALDQIEAARRGYWRALGLVGEAPDPRARLYDRVAAADVGAACRARLAVLPPARADAPLHVVGP